jgi:hypothetical protein
VALVPGAAQLKDLVSGKQNLPDMLEDDRVLLAKLVGSFTETRTPPLKKIAIRHPSERRRHLVQLTSL